MTVVSASTQDAGQPQDKEQRNKEQDRESKPDPASVDQAPNSSGQTEKAGQPIRGGNVDWDTFFEQQRDPLDVRKLVFQLHEAREYDQVIAVIRTALRQGQSQPWMYGVLALSLEIEGAPQSQVERALMSQVDFAAGDPAQTMLSAAYLTRFGAKKPALRLYRQAADLAPQRPEPYIMGLDLARQLKDDEALAWAVKGIFATAWGEDFKQQHRRAENMIADRVRELRSAGKAAVAKQLEAVLAESKQVDLEVRLEWSGAGDLDLIVKEPMGTTCSFKNQRTPGGGVLAHDGHGPRQEECYDRYVCATGFPGVYRLTVKYAWGDIVGKRAKLIITQYGGTPRQSRREIILPVTDEGSVVRVALMGGRRENLMKVPTEKPATKKTSLKTTKRPDAAEIRAARRFHDTVFQQVGAGRAVGLNPLVGVGAVGYQPVISVIPSGAMLGARAVVSPDRRYVRLSLSPSFTEVINVFNFQFNSQ